MFTAFEKKLPQNTHTDKLLVKIRKAAEECIKKDIKDLSFSKYKGFFETGNRVPYEDEYIKHRRRLNVFTILCLSGEDYISELEDALWAICNEFTWALPAHVGDRTIEQTPFIIDLFSAETAFTLSEILSLTEDIINPMVSDRIRYEVRRRIINPYVNGQTELPKPANNWAAVCGAGVGAAMLYLCSPDEASKYIPEFIDCMNRFLQSYNDDGCCKEGALYWEYGFGYYCYFAELLYKYTSGAVNLMEGEKIHNIALYRQKITLDKNYVIPFSDASHNFSFHIGLTHFLSGKFDDAVPVLPKEETEFDSDLRHRFASLIRDFYWYDESLLEKEIPKGRYSFDNSMQYIFRKDNFVLAAKGGNNAEPHNHNDLGCFVLYTNEDGYVVDDPGWADYDDKYFSEKRYENICTSSLGHSVPIINGKQQIPGANAKTVINKITDSSVEMDLSTAYGEKFIRSFKINDNSVVICDEFDENADVIQRLVTRIKPDVTDGCIKIGKSQIEVSGAEFEGIKTQTFKPRLNICECDMKETETLYLIDFCINKPKNITTICISL